MGGGVGGRMGGWVGGRVGGWAVGRREKVSETVTCRKLILGRGIG